MNELDRMLEHYVQAVRFPEVSGFEVLELLDVRSRLASRASWTPHNGHNWKTRMLRSFVTPRCSTKALRLWAI